MNNRIVQLMYNIFLENGFSVIKVNFRGVGKSDGVFDNGQGELSDAAAALDWIERQNLRLQSVLGIWFFFWIFNLYAVNYEKT